MFGISFGGDKSGSGGSKSKSHGKQSSRRRRGNDKHQPGQEYDPDRHDHDYDQAAGGYAEDEYPGEYGNVDSEYQVASGTSLQNQYRQDPRGYGGNPTADVEPSRRAQPSPRPDFEQGAATSAWSAPEAYAPQPEYYGDSKPKIHSSWHQKIKGGRPKRRGEEDDMETDSVTDALSNLDVGRSQDPYASTSYETESYGYSAPPGVYSTDQGNELEDMRCVESQEGTSTKGKDRVDQRSRRERQDEGETNTGYEYEHDSLHPGPYATTDAGGYSGYNEDEQGGGSEYTRNPATYKWRDKVEKPKKARYDAEERATAYKHDPYDAGGYSGYAEEGGARPHTESQDAAGYRGKDRVDKSRRTRHDAEERATAYKHDPYDAGGYSGYAEEGGARPYTESQDAAGYRGKDRVDKSRRTRHDAEEFYDHDDGLNPYATSTAEAGGYSGYAGQGGEREYGESQGTAAYKGKGKAKDSKRRKAVDMSARNGYDEDREEFIETDTNISQLRDEGYVDNGGFDENQVAGDITESGDYEQVDNHPVPHASDKPAAFNPVTDNSLLPTEPIDRWEVVLMLKESSTKTLRWKEAWGFLDTGNRVGPLILQDTVLALGYGSKHIDFDKMVEFDTFGGLVQTCGVITLAYQIVSMGGVQTEVTQTENMQFNILKRSLDKYEVWLRPQDNGYPNVQAHVSGFAAASMRPKRDLTKEEKKQKKESFEKAEKEALRRRQKQEERERREKEKEEKEERERREKEKEERDKNEKREREREREKERGGREKGKERWERDREPPESSSRRQGGYSGHSYR